MDDIGVRMVAGAAVAFVTASAIVLPGGRQVRRRPEQPLQPAHAAQSRASRADCHARAASSTLCPGSSTYCHAHRRRRPLRSSCLTSRSASSRPRTGAPPSSTPATSAGSPFLSIACTPSRGGCRGRRTPSSTREWGLGGPGAAGRHGEPGRSSPGRCSRHVRRMLADDARGTHAS